MVGKAKFKSAAHAKAARELEASWQALLKRHSASVFGSKSTASINAENPQKDTRPKQTREIASLVTPGHSTALPKQKVYTGTKILGVATMHKSNLVPVFSPDEAKSLASMRR